MNKKQAAYYALAVLFVINALNFFDRQIIGAVGEPIRDEFGLSDSALGALIRLLFCYTLLSVCRSENLPDKYSRKKILAIGVFVWSLMTAASGLARNFWQIFAMRLGVGVGEASCAPAASSLIGDFFPSEKRGKAIQFLCWVARRFALSFAVSRPVAKNYGWRAAFFVAGLPGLLCMLAVLFIKEPTRGAAETIDVGGKKREGSTCSITSKIADDDLADSYPAHFTISICMRSADLLRRI